MFLLKSCLTGFSEFIEFRSALVRFMFPLQIFGFCKLLPDLLYHVTLRISTSSKIQCLKQISDSFRIRLPL
nr:hypothetical protein Iba_chr07aCG1900 [Ipomoea batatas]